MEKKWKSNLNPLSDKLKKAISILLATVLLVGLASSVGTVSQATTQGFTGLSAGQTVNVYRFFNPEMQYHFYTNDAAERDSLIHRNWGNFEGIAFVGDVNDTVPVYRLFSPILRVHHYTADQVERRHLAASGAWNDEGVVFHAAEEGIPVYRLFHPGVMRHLYTSDANERRVLRGRGWNDEGIAWYARTLGQPIPDFVFSRDLGDGRFEVGIENPTKSADAVIYFATWSEYSNQGDLVWRRGTAYGNRWTAIIPAWDHNYSGTFVTHVQAWMEDGSHVTLGQISFQVPESAMLPPAQRRIRNHTDNVINSVGADLASVYWWTVNNISRSWLPIHVTPPDGYTRAEYYAVIGFERRTGNCFVFAATFYQLAKALGYDARYVEGQVDAAAGGFVPHGWVKINIGGNTYIFDPEAQRSLGGRGLNFFRQPVNRPTLSYRW